MLINMTAEGNVCVKNLAQTTFQHLAFRETINSILTATNQVQLTYIVLIVSAEVPEREGSISIQLLQAIAQLLVTNASLIFLADEFFFLFLV